MSLVTMNVELDDRCIGYADLLEALSRSPILKLDADEFQIKGCELTIPRMCEVRLRHEVDVTRSGGVSALSLTRVLGGRTCNADFSRRAPWAERQEEAPASTGRPQEGAPFAPGRIDPCQGQGDCAYRRRRPSFARQEALISHGDRVASKPPRPVWSVGELPFEHARARNLEGHPEDR